MLNTNKKYDFHYKKDDEEFFNKDMFRTNNIITFTSINQIEKLISSLIIFRDKIRKSENNNWYIYEVNK